MSNTLDSYLDSVRAKARDVALKAAGTRIQAKRKAEKLAAQSGVSIPFHKLNLADIENLPEAERAALSTFPEFLRRREALVEEFETECAASEEAAERAAAAAMGNLPPEVALADSHESERGRWISARGYESEEDFSARAPAPLRAEFKEILKSQIALQKEVVDGVA